MKKTFHVQRRPRAAFFVAAAMAVSSAIVLGGCDKSDNRTVGEKVDAGLAKTEQAAKTAAAKTREVVTDPKLKADLKDAGAVMSAKVNDATITASISAGLARDPDLSAITINVTTRDGAVSLKGPAPSADAKTRAGDIAKSIQGVTSVDNQLQVRS